MIYYSLKEINGNSETTKISFSVEGHIEIPYNYFFIELNYGSHTLRNINVSNDFVKSNLCFEFDAQEIQNLLELNSYINMKLYVEINEDIIEVPYDVDASFKGITKLNELSDIYSKWEYIEENLVVSEVTNTSLEYIYSDSSEVITFYYKAVSEENRIKEIIFISNESSKKQSQAFKSKDLGNFFYSFTINLESLMLSEGKWNVFFLKENNEKFSPIKFVDIRRKKTLDVEGQGLLKFIFNNKKQFTCRVVRLKTNTMILNLIDIVREKNKLKIIIKSELRFYEAKNFDLKKVDSITMVHLGTKIKTKVPILFSKLDTECFELSIDLEKLEEIEDLGVWDIYINYYSKNDNYFTQRVKFNESKFPFFAMKPYEFKNYSDNHITIRFYITKDRFLRSVVKKYSFKGQIDTVSYNNDEIIINGDINYSSDKILNVKPIFKNNEGLIEKYEAIAIDYVKIKYGIKYKLCLKSEVLLEKLIEGNYEIQLAITNDCNDVDYVPLVSNVDDIENKNKVIQYPTKLYEKADEIMSYRVYYDKNNILFFERKNKFTQYTKILDNGKYYIIEVKTFREINKENCILLINEEDKVIKSYYPVSIYDKKIIYYIDKTDFKNMDSFEAQLILSYMGIKEYLNSYTSLDEKKYSTRLNSKYYLSFRLENRKIIFEKRKPSVFEQPIIKYKNRFAKLFAMLFKKFYRNKVWLFGENLGEVAQDNGLAFFEYVLKNKPERAYYVSKKDNKNSINLKHYSKHILEYDSFRHMYYYHISEFLLFSHGIRDVMPTILHKSMKLNKKDIIYLQHGVIAMKKVFFNQNSYNGRIKKFVVTSEQEKNILIKHMNFRQNQIMVTGLARFDKLKNSDFKQDKKKILIMPTWREWLVNDREKFIHSDFYKNYISLLTNKGLLNYAKDKNIEFIFYPHIEIQKKYIDLFEVENSTVKIIKIEEKPLNELLEECSLLITDYSSVAFDFNYFNKPVIFFQFDKKDYLRKRGSFVDMDTNLIGKSASNIDELVILVKEKITNDFQMSLEEIKKSDNYYQYRDQSNSNRIYEEVKKLGERK